MALRGRAAAQHILQLGSVLRLLLLQLKQEVVQFVAGIGVQVTLTKGIGAHRPTFTKCGGDGRRRRGQQFGEQPYIALTVLAQARLAGDQLDHYLGLAQQRTGHRRLGLQRLLRLRFTQRGGQFISTLAEFGDLLGVVADRRQVLHPGGKFSFGIGQARYQRLHLTGLADDAFDLDQIFPVFHFPAQLQRRAQ